MAGRAQVSQRREARYVYMSNAIDREHLGVRPDPKIIEIGSAPFMWRAFPHTTQFYSTWPDERFQNDDRGFHIFSLKQLPGLTAALQSAEFNMVVVHSSPLAPWTLNSVSRTLFNRSAVEGHLPLFRRFGQQMIRCRVTAPIFVLDFDDPAVISRSDVFLLDKAKLYFKRELPADHWRLFAGTLHRSVPTPRFRSIVKHQNRLSKILPISLGVSPAISAWVQVYEIPKVKKSADVFFAGQIKNSSTVRPRGLEELLSLKAEGYVIDVCDQRLPIDEYLARCAAARVVWAPEGFGWQTFRQYEAALCGSVPLCNRPTIELHKPLVHGVHALYYDPEPGSLRQVLAVALAEREKLSMLGAAARDHVLAHHTPTAIARYVAERALRNEDPSFEDTPVHRSAN
jgi:hypothetical protein